VPDQPSRITFGRSISLAIHITNKMNHRHLLFLMLLLPFQAAAERIFILTGTGYNRCDPELVAAIEGQGHTVVTSVTGPLPAGLTTTCIDPVNGFDWVALFGDMDHSNLIPELQQFVSEGGKLFLQWEVTCCVNAAIGSAAIASAITGLNISPSSHQLVAFNGWTAEGVAGCANFLGNAYRCFNGVPPQNQLLATGTLEGADPHHSVCPVFGFSFGPDALPSGAGGLVGFGDVNIWYQNMGEPPNNFGEEPVDPAPLQVVFPAPGAACQLLPDGCLGSGSTGIGRQDARPKAVYPNPVQDLLFIETGATCPPAFYIHDAFGRMIMEVPTNGVGLLTVPVGALAPGIYRLGDGSGSAWVSSFVVT
jgi:hypothetical protein